MRKKNKQLGGQQQFRSNKKSFAFAKNTERVYF